MLDELLESHPEMRRMCSVCKGPISDGCDCEDKPVQALVITRRVIAERLYGIQVVNELTGKATILDLIPMTHEQACTMKSKMTPYKWRRVELWDTGQTGTGLAL